ncbi:unnamed protein product [Clavelina lepadiformis]|uniref:Histidine ammonia-lyase n=1 Tax=Clavelina lepadiformis TaxID=159417 RepID=A0ABP0GJ28_CLALP
MKVYVNVENVWMAVHCAEGNKPISWLIQELAERSKDIGVDILKSEDYILKATKQDILYNTRDNMADVLEDKQFLILAKKESLKKTIFTDLPENKLIADTLKFNDLSIQKLNEQGTVILNGQSLTTDTLWQLSTGNFKVQISEDALSRVKQSRKLLDDIVTQNKVVYGVSTGFGKFARVVIAKEDLDQLQVNLIESHCAGVGQPLSPERTRMMLALRINVLCKGYSGITVRNLLVLQKAFNASCLPWIPEKGTVGASGDLAPLSHLAVGLMGKGMMWSPKSGWANASHVMEANGIETLKLGPKEGLALINGTQFIASLGSEAVQRAKQIALQADVAAALTLEALQGTSRAFDEAIHEARPHKGQLAVAKRLRALLQYGADPSEITQSHRNCDRVQDAYTLRCCPQVHGIAHDTVEFVNNILNVELNSATDNPMVLIDRGETISGGNFHGEYPAKALDYLAIGVHELASMSERRIERLCNPSYSDLPAFLVQDGGLNSGFMIPHCTAAALVSENKGLCHPSSVDSLSTSAGQEDHVSMGGWAARKVFIACCLIFDFFIYQYFVYCSC